MTHLRFSVLGSLEVFRGEDPIPLPTGRRRVLLACLLVHAGRAVPADVLVEAAWGDDLPEDPRAALHTALSRLRAALPDVMLSSGAAGYILQVGEAALDAHRFDALRTRANSAPADEAALLLSEALALWRGPAYAEFADRDFAAAEAARLDRLRLDVAEQQAALLVESGNHRRAITELEKVLVSEPFREQAVELLATALYRSGRQADALARLRAHRALLAQELGLDASPILQDLELRILSHDLPQSAERTATCPVPDWLDRSTPFLGRSESMTELVDAAAANRIVTVTGTGGVGKTRLVAEALRPLCERLQVGVVVVELGSVPTGRVAFAIARALQLGPQPSSVIDSILDYLSAAQLLLVLDSCEHIRAEVSALVAAISRRGSRVRVVATSRHRLGLPSERVVRLDPLPLPEVRRSADPDAIGRNPAVQLFTDTVRRLRPSFALLPERAAAVVEICTRLEGLPLALELAAARVAAVGVDQVLGSLGTGSASGKSGVSLPDLTSLVECSAQLLTAEQQELLCYLTVFADTFDAEAVIGLTARLSPPLSHGQGIVTTLADLVDSSLLASQTSGGTVTYRLLAFVRLFASGRLEASGQEARLRLAHARWVQEAVEQAAQDWISGDAAVADTRLTAIEADLLTALRWALDHGRMDIAGRLTAAIQQCMHRFAGVELSDLFVAVGERCAAAAEQSAPAAEQHLGLGVAASAMALVNRGEVERARTQALRALTLVCAAPESSGRDTLPWVFAHTAIGIAGVYSGGDVTSAQALETLVALPGVSPAYRAEASTTRSLLACYSDDLAVARRWASIARVGAEATQAEAACAFALYATGEIEVRDDPDRGVRLFREAASKAEQIGASHVSQVARLALFAVLVRRRRYQEALDLVIPLLDDIRRVGSWPQIWTTLRIAAELFTSLDRFEDAALLLAAANAAPTAPPAVGEDIERYRALHDELRTQLGTPVVEGIGALAAGLAPAQVVARAAAVLTDTGSAIRSKPG